MFCFVLLMMLSALGAQAEPREDILGLMNQVDRFNLMDDLIWLEDIGDPDPDDNQHLGTRCAATVWADSTALAIRDRLIGYGWDVGLEPVSFVHPDPDIGQVDSWNVIARRDGWSADGIVIMGCHYDTVDEKTDEFDPMETATTSYDDPYSPAPGADDNGSGTAALLEIARILGSATFSQDVELCFFTAEEIGIKGSEQHVAALDAADINVAGYFNVDMIGWDVLGPWDFRLYYDNQSTWFKNAVVNYLNDYTSMPYEVVHVGDSWSNSDLLHFWQTSKPAVGFWEGNSAEDHAPYWNQSLDTIQNSISGSGDFLAEMTKVVLAAFCEWSYVRVSTDAPNSLPTGGLLASWPNPFRPDAGATSLRYGRGAAGLDAEINIFDVSGRLQRVLRTNSDGLTRWDGRDTSGELLPAGIYLARVAGETQMKAERIVLLR